MPRISLLQVKALKYDSANDLKRLIKQHKDDLAIKTEQLEHPSTDAAINAIAYNLVRLMRELNKHKRQKAKLLVLPGGKKD